MEPETCAVCETEPSIGTKRDVEISYDADANEIKTVVEFPIGAACEGAYYDGSEDFPGLAA